jgi:hypothetical protein
MPRVVPISKEIQHAVNKLKLDKNKLPPILPLPKQVTIDTIIKVKSAYPVLNDQTLNDYYKYLNANLDKFKRRSFKEFDYLSVEPSTGAVIFIYMLALIIAIGVNFWVINNEIYN